MFLPKINAPSSEKTVLKVFGGLDKRDKISDSALSDSKNMSTDSAPALATRKAHKEIVSVPGTAYIFPPEQNSGDLTAFTGVSNGSFFYNGTKISGSLTLGQKSLADFNGKICIFPDKKYYRYVPDPTTGKIDTSLTSMEKNLNISSARFYSSYNELTGDYTAYIEASADFAASFSTGDSVIISGCSVTHNNTVYLQSRKDFAAEDDIVSAVVDKASNGRLNLLLYNKSGAKATFTNASESGTVTVKMAVPDMDCICVHNNRLWGTAVSGEYIYASKLGDCTNFNSFQGLSTDSWYSSIATGGGFTGICSYRTAVVAFKQNYIHHIYGDSPTNFSIPKQTFGGCVDSRSICEIGGILYYLSQDGFCAYSGGEPYRISPQFKTKYTSCAAGTDGLHYLASAQKSDGTADVLVYNPDFDIWIREDDTLFHSFCTFNGDIYGIGNGKMQKLHSGSDPVKWSFFTKNFTYDKFSLKGLSCIRLRADSPADTEIEVSVSADGKPFISCGKVRGGGFLSYRLPVRFSPCDSFRIKVSGVGTAVIHNIEITNHNGGIIYG